MKANMFRAFIALVATCFLAGFGRAQNQIVDPPSAIISLETSLSGHDAIVSSLTRQSSYIRIHLSGASVVEERDQYFSSQELYAAGYVTAGSRSQLVNAIFVLSAKADFDFVEINGGFDIKLDVYVMSSQGGLVLRGYGYVESLQATDKVSADQRVKFSVNLTAPNNITVQAPSHLNAAKWVSENGTDQPLDVDWGNDTFRIPTGFLNEGTLVLSTGGEKGGKDITSYGLRDKTVRVGYQAFAYISTLYDFDFRTYTDNLDFFQGETFIYSQGPELFGDLPVVDLALTHSVKQVIKPTLAVWGSPDLSVLPSRILVRKLAHISSDGSVGPENPEVPLQYDARLDGWIFLGEAGEEYHIRLDVQNLKPGPKG